MPTPHPCDVLVAGGGVAGVPAAVAAARTGAHTILVERRSVPGGLGVSALHRSVCGLYANGVGPPRETLNEGLQSEIAAMLSARSETSRPVRIGSVFVLPYRIADFGDVYAELVAREAGLEFLADHGITGVDTDGSRITCVHVAGPSGETTLAARAVVDCTGSAAIAARSGASLTPHAAERQLRGYVVALARLGDLGQTPGIAVPYVLRRGVEGGRLPPCMAFTAFTPCSTPGSGVCKFSLAPGDTTPTETRPPHVVLDAIAYLREHLPGFRDAEVTTHSDGILERDGSRLEGRYTLTENDVLQGRRFDGTTVRAAWPVEFWHEDKGPRYTYMSEDAPYYEIPATCVTSAGVANLFAAGRCISSTPRALASARVMGTCIATGEMAGLEAARTAC